MLAPSPSLLSTVLAGVGTFSLFAGLHLRRQARDRSVRAAVAAASDAGGTPAGRGPAIPARALWNGLAGGMARALAPLAAGRGSARLRARLTAAGIQVSAEQFVAQQVLSAAAGLLCGLAVPILAGHDGLLPVGAVAGALGGWWLPAQGLDSRSRALRAQMGREALGFADFLTAAVQAGLQLEAAVERMAGELPGRLPQVLAAAARESRLTREPFDLTLSAAAAAVDEPSVLGVVGAIVQARQTGGDLAGPLSSLVGALRQERQQQLRAAVRGRGALSSLPLIFVMLPGVMAPLAFIVFSSFHGVGV